MKKIFFGLVAVLGSVLFFSKEAQAVDMYRMYNSNSGEHLYTWNMFERDSLFVDGWDYEGVAWTYPVHAGGHAIHRLYNPNTGDHHYTINGYEVTHLEKNGWNNEGITGYSSLNTTVPVYRVYNPQAEIGSHHYTVNMAEVKQLIKAGWQDEGIGWYVYSTDVSKEVIPAEIRGNFEGRSASDKSKIRVGLTKNEVIYKGKAYKATEAKYQGGEWVISWDVDDFEERYSTTVTNTQPFTVEVAKKGIVFNGVTYDK
ncbi:hypothetical protein M2139_000381 [Enterococcus sp. PF1-24]|uniref:M23 family peptidase n=1 Tax=unclassified Enterococcus TaxID=2608891 RepID=UPI002475DD89|nr:MULTISPECIES: M23 family peptidase [unclassified Enterococcus]MDH6363406.1 hypothetical protein [Enterococcus sp. PFB1-1]MDH6400500.1 hypothetical protein [Enterococcus sp. PF1-24]